MKHHSIFSNGCINFHSHQKCTFSSMADQHLLSLVFLKVAILIGVKWYLILVLIWIALMINDLEYHFIHCWAFVWLLSIQVPCLFFSRIIFLLLNYMSFLHILDVNPLSDSWFAKFSKFCSMPFHFAEAFSFSYAEAFKFDVV